MKYWLAKSEPDAYSIDDLQRDQVEPWDGIRNYQARNFMRDEMSIGDLVVFYHSNTKPPGPVGVMKVASAPYPDPTQFDQTNKYFDPKSKPENPRWILVDMEFVEKFAHPISLDELKEIPELAEMRLLKRGNRLSVMPIEKSEFELIREMGNQ